MRPVNLIPPEQRRGDRAPLRTGALPYVLVAAVAVAVVAVSLLAFVGKQVDDREAKLANVEAEADAARAAAQGLAPYAQFALLSEARSATVSTLAQSRFDWERVMRELARVTPSDVWLTDLVGSAAPAGDEASAITGPSLKMTGCASGHEAVARFLAALEDIDGVTRVGITRSELGAKGEAGTSTGGGDAACDARAFISEFELTVAFDNVAPAIPPTAAPVEPAGATTPTSAATPEQEQAQESVKKGSEDARKAAELIPGVTK